MYNRMFKDKILSEQVAVGLIAFTVGTLFLSATQFFMSNQYSLSMFLIIALACLLAAPIIIRKLRHRDLFWVEPLNFILAICFIAYVFRPLQMLLVDLNNKYLPFGDNELLYYLNLALFYSILGIISFYIGYFLFTPWIQGRKSKFSQWSSYRALWVVVFYSVIGLICYSVYIEMSGGLWYYITHMGGIRSYDIGNFAMIYWGKYFFLVGSMLLYIEKLRTSRTSRLFTVIFMLHFLASTFILFSCAARIQLIIFWLMLIIINYLHRKTLKIPHLIGFLCIVILMVLGVKIFRSASEGGLSFERLFFQYQFRIQNVHPFNWLAPEIPWIDVFIVILRCVPYYSYPLLYGKPFLEAIMAVFPDWIFAINEATILGKRVMGAFIAPASWSARTGVNPSLLGAFYLNLSWPGILIGMFLFGIFCRKLYCYLTKNIENTTVFLIYAVSIGFVIHFSMTGSIINAIKQFIINLMIIIPACSYISKRF